MPVAATAYGQAQSAKTRILRARFATMEGEYNSRSKTDQFDKTSEEQGIEVDVKTFAAGITFKVYELGFEQRRYVPKDVDFWKDRKEIYVTTGMHLGFLPWIVPQIGFYRMTQQIDETAADASAAVINKYNAFVLGFDVMATPYLYNATHGCTILANYRYLTSFEKKRNFGNELAAGLGYTYMMTKAQITLSLEKFWQYNFAEELIDGSSDEYKSVRWKLNTTAMGFNIFY